MIEKRKMPARATRFKSSLLFVVCCGVLSIAFQRSQPALGQDTFPNRPIKLVVGFTAGGPTDTPARMIAEKLQSSLGQPVVVENKAGAGGKIALDSVLSQPRDGYTLSLCTYIDATNTVFMKAPGYKLSDIAPISQITKAYYAFAVPSTFKGEDVKSFIAEAKARPGEINYGHVGAGSMLELVARRFEQLAGIKMNGIPYKGTAEAARDLAAGRLDFMVAPLIVVRPLYDAKIVKYIGMTSPERLPAFPDVPTLIEQNFHIIDNGWLGVCAPAGVPQSIIGLLNKHVVAAVESPEYQVLMDKTGVMPFASSPQEFAKLFAETQADMVHLGSQLRIEAK